MVENPVKKSGYGCCCALPEPAASLPSQRAVQDFSTLARRLPHSTAPFSPVVILHLYPAKQPFKIND